MAAHGATLLRVALGVVYVRYTYLILFVIGTAGAVIFVYGKTGFFLRAAVIDAAKAIVARTGSEFELLLLAATVAQLLLCGGALALTRDR